MVFHAVIGNRGRRRSVARSSDNWGGRKFLAYRQIRKRIVGSAPIPGGDGAVMETNADSGIAQLIEIARAQSVNQLSGPFPLDS